MFEQIRSGCNATVLLLGVLSAIYACGLHCYIVATEESADIGLRLLGAALLAHMNLVVFGMAIAFAVLRVLAELGEWFYAFRVSPHYGAVARWLKIVGEHGEHIVANVLIAAMLGTATYHYGHFLGCKPTWWLTCLMVWGFTTFAAIGSTGIYPLSREELVAIFRQRRDGLRWVLAESPGLIESATRWLLDKLAVATYRFVRFVTFDHLRQHRGWSESTGIERWRNKLHLYTLAFLGSVWWQKTVSHELVAVIHNASDLGAYMLAGVYAATAIVVCGFLIETVYEAPWLTVTKAHIAVAYPAYCALALGLPLFATIATVATFVCMTERPDSAKVEGGETAIECSASLPVRTS
ncbi:MAG: hypothetical protein COV10_03705 [Candidatus Vogelbacteria bacterium CG10_big_fil_rev_8_21_14_0_10_51_16]|uniref:Uncharacterized protein n=1 Tax=Candidatus Vogelbacteria bacterium CG10_big_fil_rev_8_21_14_0_10_51_16 TaxID=1975045 RepID=A0A2H0RDG1_9BACT|nr:MAG: hypothetical protein COV10_03705 [Candidatus Vogelbacteria bacterium CG10_big_fil_rev_8_21_14_0_10_51_16]